MTPPAASDTGPVTRLAPGSRLRRRYSVPEQLALLGLGAAAVAVAYPYLMRVTGGYGLPCLLRTVTGVPCPLCGMTTAAVRLAAGDVTAGIAANPFIVVLVVGGVVTWGLLALRALGALPPPQPWGQTTRRAVSRVAGVLAAASWLYQLHRFDLV